MSAKQTNRLRYQILKLLHEHSPQTYSASVLKQSHFPDKHILELDITHQLNVLVEDGLARRKDVHTSEPHKQGVKVAAVITVQVFRISIAGSMLMEERHDKKVNRYLSIGSFIISVVALWFSYKANNVDKPAPVSVASETAAPVQRDTANLKVTPVPVAKDTIPSDSTAAD